uniref:Protein kinase domain-containing protein n=1 Tax=Strongyloides papillosus TaxID=174720 RepID=A0A0N5BBW8_STREA
MNQINETIDLDSNFILKSRTDETIEDIRNIPNGYKIRHKNCNIVFDKIIGEGSYGKVYLVYADNKKLALKLTNDGDECRLIQTYLTPYEIGLFYSKNNNSNPPFIKYLGSGSLFYNEKFYHYYLMPYYVQSLSEFLKHSKDSIENIFFTIALRIMNALGYLCSKNITHGDIKPSYILLKIENNLDSCVLSDYGTSKFQPSFKNEKSVGTYMFMSLDAHL